MCALCCTSIIPVSVYSDAQLRWGGVTLVFLSLLMLALTAKLIGVASLGYNVVPAIFIIPAFALLAITSSFVILKNIFTVRKGP